MHLQGFTSSRCLWFGGGVFLGILLASVASGASTRGPYASTTESPYCDEPAANLDTLQMLHVVMRHGARTPVNTYPKDPYTNHTFWPYGWGHLTNTGKRESYEMGKWLQKRYGPFLGPYYSPDVLYAQSTASPRTMMTLELVLAALYPPKDTAMEWNDKLDWQPIPVYTEPLEKDAMLRMETPCPRYDAARQEVFQRPEVIQQIEPYREMLANLTELTGMDMSTPADVNSIYNTFLTEENYGLELPSWANDYYPQPMEDLAARHYDYNSYTDEMKMLKAGPFLSKWLRDLKAQEAGTLQPKDRRIIVYLAHDWTITNILRALDVWQTQVPNFSFIIALELHRNPETSESYVEIYIKEDLDTAVELLTVPGCAAKCSLRQLEKLTEKVQLKGSYEEMCRLPDK